MKKALEIIKKVLVSLLVVFSIVMVIFTLISVNTFDRNDRSIFGYKAYIVRSDSMSKTDFEAGDLALVKEVNPKTLKEGDIISFISTEEESYGETVTHKIRKITKNSKGELSFVTYGTTTNTDDKNIVAYDFVLGKYVGHIPNVGSFFMYLKTTPGYLLCIFLPFALLTAYQTVKSFMLFKKYKAEQMKEVEEKLEAERQKLKEEQERLEAERKQTLEMIEELKKMKTEELSKRETTIEETPKKSTKKKSTSTQKNTAKKTAKKTTTVTKTPATKKPQPEKKPIVKKTTSSVKKGSKAPAKKKQTAGKKPTSSKSVEN